MRVNDQEVGRIVQRKKESGVSKKVEDTLQIGGRILIWNLH